MTFVCRTARSRPVPQRPLPLIGTLATLVFLALAVVLAPTQRAEADWLGYEGHPLCDGTGTSSIAGYCPDVETACESWALYAGEELIRYYFNRDGKGIITSARCVMPDPLLGEDHVGVFMRCDPSEAENGEFASGCMSPQPEKDLGECSSCRGDSADVDLSGSVAVANPINVATGNKYQREVDFRTTGERGFVFARHHNSYAQRSSALGPGWRHSFDLRLHVIDASTVEAMRPDGRVLTFTGAGAAWSAGSDVVLDFVQTAGGYEINAGNDAVETYDSSGRLLTIDYRGGYQQTLAYNAGGQLETVTDSEGRSIGFTYNALDQLETVTDPDGGVYRYAYQPRTTLYPGQPSEILSSVAAPDDTPLDPGDDPTRTYHYEDTRFPIALTGITDERGLRYATFAYDAEGRGILSEHAGGADSTTIAYNPSGTRTVTNALGKQTTYTFQSVAGRPKLTLAAGHASASCVAANRAQSYDANGFLASATDWEGHQTDYVHNAQGLETSRTLAVGTPQARTITTAWHASFRLPTQIVEPGLTTDLTYDAAGRLSTVTLTDTTTGTVPYSTNGQTRTTSFTYDAAGRLATVDGPRAGASDVTTYSHDAAGNLTLVSNALGQDTALSQHNGLGLPEQILDANGVVRRIAYNARGWPLSVTVEDPDGEATTHYAYDGVGQVEGVTLPNGTALSYEYDAARRLTAIANDLGERLEYGHDALGNRTSQTLKAAGDSVLRSHSWAYDELGRLLDSIGAASQTTSFAYDKNGRPVSVTDGAGETTLRAFDPLGRFVEATLPLAGAPTADYAYDDQDNLTDVTDPVGLTTTYRYNGFGETIAVESPDSGTTVYLRDTAGNLTSETDARGVVTDYSHDVLNRVTAKTFPAAPAEDVAYGYDDDLNGNYGIGRLTSVTDQSGATAYRYGPRGNLIGETRTIGTAVYTTEYRYDLADNVIAITYPSGRIVTYLRDALGRIERVTSQADSLAPPVTLASDITYLPFGPIETLTFANGLQVTYSYDQDYRLAGVVLGDGLVTLQQHGYSYNAVDNVAAINDLLDAGKSQAFGYDPLQRLDSASGLYGALLYGYDDNGNRLSRSRDLGGIITNEVYGYDAFSNRLASVDDGLTLRALSHDAAGNTVSDDRGAAGLYGYGFNEAGRLASVTRNSVAEATYLYNAFGERVVKDRAGQITHYHYDPAGRLIGESDGLGQTLRSYVYLDGLPLVEAVPAGAGGFADVVIDNDDPGASGNGAWTSETAGANHEGIDYALRDPAPAVPAGGTIFDNDGAGFAMIGNWGSETTGAGFEGADYRSRTGGVSSGFELVIDNSDPGFLTVGGSWSTLTQCCGHFGADYTLGVPNQPWPDDLLLEESAPEFAASANWFTQNIHLFSGGAGKLRKGVRDLPPEAIIADNNDPSTQIIGGWWASTAASGRYGANHLHKWRSNGAAQVIWHLQVPTSGRYMAFVRKGYHPYHWHTPYSVTHDGGTTSTSIYMKVSGDAGQWQRIGTFDYTAGQDYTFRTHDNLGKSFKYAYADAVALVPEDALPADTAVWTPTIAEEKEYDLWTHWYAYSDRTPQAVYVIRHKNGVERLTFNQQINGGQWVHLGRYTLSPGAGHGVEIGQFVFNHLVVADALRIRAADALPSRAVWDLAVPRDDHYKLEANWKYYPDYAADAAFTTVHAGGSSTVVHDQTVYSNAVIWRDIGAHRLTPGQGHQVYLSDQTNGKPSADAIRVTEDLSATRTASWQVSVPASGAYRVYAKWPALAGLASAAPYAIGHDGGIANVTANQRQKGGEWVLLGTHDYSAGQSYDVTLSDAATDGAVVADALYLVAEPTAVESFTWQTALPVADDYTVYARWSSDGGRTDAATYAVTHGAGNASVVLDQRAGAGEWRALGSWAFDPAVGPAIVELTGPPEGTLAADALRFVAAGALDAGASYLHADHLGRPRAASDTSGTLAWTRETTPFGEVVQVTGTGETKLLFPGQQDDAESGLSYNYFRDYDPTTGRYIESDPIGLAGGLNTYGYVLGNPINLVDPKGLDVLVIQNGPTEGNPFGHTAVAVEGQGTFSHGNAGNLGESGNNTNNLNGTSTSAYLDREKERRDTTIYRITTTPEQDQIIANFMRRHDSVVEIYPDNCTNRVFNALDEAGLLPIPPLYPNYSPTPPNLDRLMKTQTNLGDVESTNIPNGDPIPEWISDFDPQ